MVTLALLLFYGGSVLILSYIDTFFYDISLIESVSFMLYPEGATRESIVVLAMMAGIIYSIIVDYRHRKNKQTVSK
ncbi:hypothetical protein [Bacillus sp. AK128]